MKLADLTPQELPAGIIIIGGGARLGGFSERLEQLSGMRVRSGMANVSLRIGDGRINPVEMIDVMSVLYAVAADRPKECLSEIEPEPEPELPDPAEETPDPADVPQQPTRKKRGFLASLREKMTGMLIAPEDDDDNDELRDDD